LIYRFEVFRDRSRKIVAFIVPGKMYFSPNSLSFSTVIANLEFVSVGTDKRPRNIGDSYTSRTSFSSDTKRGRGVKNGGWTNEKAGESRGERSEGLGG